MFDTFKELLDRLLAVILIVSLFPLFFLISIAIKIDSKGPIIFKQSRIGKGKKVFNIYKFRTMHSTTPSQIPTHRLTEAEKYITKIGKLLRSTSLDELPQIFNVILGNMSFVGPRPALWNQEDLIKMRDEKNIHSIKPGITGWAQVFGRDKLTIEKKVDLDFYYLRHRSVLLDFKIILKTINVVLRKKDNIEGGTSRIGIYEDKK